MQVLCATVTHHVAPADLREQDAVVGAQVAARGRAEKVLPAGQQPAEQRALQAERRVRLPADGARSAAARRGHTEPAAHSGTEASQTAWRDANQKRYRGQPDRMVRDANQKRYRGQPDHMVTDANQKRSRNGQFYTPEIDVVLVKCKIMQRRHITFCGFIHLTNQIPRSK